MRLNNKKDNLRNKILGIINKTEEPLETAEIQDIIKKETRIRILYRLNNLRGDSLIKGKRIGSGKGAWIWWRIDDKKQ